MQKLHAANDIVELFRAYTTVKKSGRVYMCCCPFHTEKTPSCAIYPESQSFYCFGCGAGGDVISFVEKMDNISFYEAVQLLAQKSNLAMPTKNPQEERTANLRRRCLEINRETARIYFANLIKGSDPRGLQYFQSRGLRMETIHKYGLGFAPDDWHQLRDYLRSKGFSDDEMVIAGVCRRADNGSVYDYFRNRVIFPIIDLRKNIVAFGGRVLDDSKPKYLNTNDTPVYNKGSNLFSLNFAKDGNPETFILGEGYMDVIAMHQAGFTNAIATLGTALTNAQVRLISRYVEQVILSYDSDGAGQTATARALNLFYNADISVRILKMEGAKDPDEYLKKYGADNFKLLLSGSEDVLDYRLRKAEEGLNMSSSDGKTQYLKRAVHILAEIDSELRRSIYIFAVAQKAGVQNEVVIQQIDGQRKKLGRQETAQRFQVAQKNISPQQMLPPNEQQYGREFRAEERILAYLLLNPENVNQVMSRVTPEYFFTEFHKRVYTTICQNVSENPEFTPRLTVLSQFFTSEEMGKITGIQSHYQEGISVTEGELQDCINLLYQSRNSMKSQSNISEEDLEKYLQEKRKKKGNSNF